MFRACPNRLWLALSCQSNHHLPENIMKHWPRERSFILTGNLLLPSQPQTYSGHAGTKTGRGPQNDPNLDVLLPRNPRVLRAGRPRPPWLCAMMPGVCVPGVLSTCTYMYAYTCIYIYIMCMSVYIYIYIIGVFFEGTPFGWCKGKPKQINHCEANPCVSVESIPTKIEHQTWL